MSMAMRPSAAPAAPQLSPRASMRWDVVRRVVEDLAPRSVLEVGCGQGAMGARLAERCETYVGVEPDPASQAVAVSRIAPRGGTVLAGDHTVAPDSDYDLLCAFEVLEHIDDHEAALAAWVRLVRPGGHVLLSVPAWPDRFGPSDTKVGHFRRYTPEQLAATMTGAGLEAPVTTLYGWPLGYALERVGHALDARALARGTAPQDMAARSATSGRNRQSANRLVGAGVRWGTVPFIRAQRLVRRGIGMVAVAQRPDA